MVYLISITRKKTINVKTSRFNHVRRLLNIWYQYYHFDLQSRALFRNWIAIVFNFCLVIEEVKRKIYLYTRKEPHCHPVWTYQFWLRLHSFHHSVHFRRDWPRSRCQKPSPFSRFTISQNEADLSSIRLLNWEWHTPP